MGIIEYLLFLFMIFVLFFLSGMLGLGVAFISTPVLGMFGFDLKNVIMPWSLLLTDLTGSSVVAFTQSKMVDGRTAVPFLLQLS